MIIFTIALSAFIVFLTLLVVNHIRKKPIAKIAVALGASFWIAFISVFIGAILDPDIGTANVAFSLRLKKRHLWLKPLQNQNWLRLLQ